MKIKRFFSTAAGPTRRELTILNNNTVGSTRRELILMEN
jgi:hypothetical protein